MGAGPEADGEAPAGEDDDPGVRAAADSVRQANARPVYLALTGLAA